MIARGMVLTTAAATLAVVGQSSPAAALPCGVSGPDVDQSAYGKKFTRSVSLRNGPDWQCDVTDTATINNSVDYHCFVYDANWETWTYLRTATTKYGWVWDGYLSDGGSQIHCSNG
ncbi:SH3 domain-containing protein [Catellatospora vulcania]|uniref:SH3 domain-containing protein n=1 Tax=Catellatospora vulcania TaxID=1460450 RepID=UPI0018AFF60E|nr:SH3 domain-containing protein [Catellatospora vulcania]